MHTAKGHTQCKLCLWFALQNWRWSKVAKRFSSLKWRPAQAQTWLACPNHCALRNLHDSQKYGWISTFNTLRLGGVTVDYEEQWNKDLCSVLWPNMPWRRCGVLQQKIRSRSRLKSLIQDSWVWSLESNHWRKKSSVSAWGRIICFSEQKDGYLMLMLWQVLMLFSQSCAQRFWSAVKSCANTYQRPIRQDKTSQVDCCNILCIYNYYK